MGGKGKRKSGSGQGQGQGGGGTKTKSNKSKKGRKRKSRRNEETDDSSNGEGPRTPLRPSGKTADWDKFLKTSSNLRFIPSVSMFKHAPLTDVWEEFATVGLRIEVPNPFVVCSKEVYWIAKVVYFAGYRCLIEFENLGIEPKNMAWMSFCSGLPKQLGHCDKNEIILSPPPHVRAKCPNFIERARMAISGTAMLKYDVGEYVKEKFRSLQKYDIGTLLEVMDSCCISRMRLAKVNAKIGDRIHIYYIIEPKHQDRGFWFNINSDKVQLPGWSHTVGHPLYGVPDGHEFVSLSPDHFPKYPEDLQIMKGQVFEVRHPNKPHLICSGRVTEVFKYGYFMFEIRSDYLESLVPVTFSYHITSPYVLPCGFCKEWGINLVPPYGEIEESFSWEEYLKLKLLTPLPVHLLPARPVHGFKRGMKMECIDILMPTFLGPVTIVKIGGHLMMVHFDGYPRDNQDPSEIADLWVDSESPEIYPIGFGELVGHEFQSCVDPPNPLDIDEY